MTARHAVLALFLWSLPAVADQPLVVEVAVVASNPDISVNALVGEIAARDQLIVSFPSGGRITAVEVEEGDKVDEGQVLANMEAVQQEQALRAAEAGVATAQADFDQAQEDRVRQNTLLERGATTRIARDAAEDALNVAKGNLDRANAERDRAQKALDDTIVRADSAATVISRMVEPGQVVNAAQPVLELALGAELDALFEVPEALFTEGPSATEIELTLLERPEQKFTGQVREVSPLVDPGTGTVAVKVGIGDAPEGATYGDAVRGVARVAASNRIVLPYTAMSTTKDGPAVWVVDGADNRVTIRQVEVDRFETGKVILRNGLEDGTLVVTKGAQLLYPGRQVSYVEGAQ